MSDPREWSDSDWSDFYESYENPEDAAEAANIIEDIITEAEAGNWEETGPHGPAA